MEQNTTSQIHSTLPLVGERGGGLLGRRLYGNLIFELSKKGRKGYSLPQDYDRSHTTAELPEALRRKEAARLPECDELTVVRHYTNLSHNNFGVNDGFYPLGSCTMKYNPVINEEIAAMDAFAGLHPLQPAETCQGALEVYYNLQRSLAELAGLSEFTLNPCAGAHGELTGLMVIRAYHEAMENKKIRNEEMKKDEAPVSSYSLNFTFSNSQRTKVLIPDSAHGTNPASAAVCGLEVVEVKSLADGTVDVEHLRQLLDEMGDQVAAMMMTNPNTLGIFDVQRGVNLSVLVDVVADAFLAIVAQPGAGLAEEVVQELQNHLRVVRVGGNGIALVGHGGRRLDSFLFADAQPLRHSYVKPGTPEV